MAPKRELHVLYEDDHVRISELVAPAPGRNAAVAFTGIGHKMGGIPAEEFISSASTGERAAIFVTDKNRTWFNAPGLYERVIEQVKPRLQDAPRTMTLGNSMGAFGALLFAGPLEADCALAFAPQASVSPRIVPEEKRWRALTSTIAEFRFEDINDYLVDGVRYYAFHSSAKDERHQLDAFRPHRELREFVFDGLGHGLAASLKEARLLPPLFTAALKGDDAEITRLAASKGGGLRSHA